MIRTAIRPALLSAALFCSAGLLAGFLAVPGEPERLAMLVRDGRYEEALDRLAALPPHLASRPEILYEAFALNARFGDPDAADVALVAYLARRPDDVAAHRVAADFFRARNRPDALVAALERLATIAPERDELDRLTRLHRLEGRAEDELRVLLARTRLGPPERGGLAAQDELRLGRLLAAKGERDPAAAALARAHGAAPADREIRTAFFAALLATGRFGEAAARAGGWIAEPEAQTWDTDHFATRLVRAGASADEILALVPVAGDARAWRRLGALAFTLAREGRDDLLRRAVVSWLGLGEGLAPAERERHLDAVVGVALDHGLAATVFARFGAVLREEGGRAELGALAGALYDRLGYAGIAPVRHLLDQEAMADNPLLMAGIFHREGNRRAARHFLESADTAAMSRRRALAWWGLASESLSDAERLAIALAQFRSERLHPDLVRPMVGLAQAAGRRDVLVEVWARVRRDAEEPARLAEAARRGG
ncbi:hypothetical protein [Salinarimonas sp.]|uniref:hypothetical protein n=1 Tax=Salinarimonas sp. TaxID=2766526 RepID=UPI003919EAC4